MTRSSDNNPDQPESAEGAQNARLFARLPALNYLQDKDRYISKPRAVLYRFAVIGCGIMGTEHIRNTLLEGRAEIGGLFDQESASIAHAQHAVAKYGQTTPAKEYSSVTQLSADTTIDAIFICTPNHTHLEVLRSVLATNKPIFLEKPIATSIEDAWQVCKLAATHPQFVRFGLQYRYKAIYAEAIREVLEHKGIGEVQAISMLEHRFPFLDKVNQWNKFNEYSGGTLIEKCCHYFDLLNLFAQSRPRRVYASGRQAVNFKSFRYGDRNADGLDHASVIIDYENGVVGNFELCMFVPGSHEQLIVNADQGRLRAEENSVLGAENKNSLEIWRGEQGVSTVNHPTYPTYIDNAGHQGSTFFEHVAFVDDLISGGYSGPGLADGFWSVVVGAAAQQSIATGAPVEVSQLLPASFDPALLTKN